uniref:DUF2523 domain-containing protein n=1 Tax=viral metagenome TaxID=1070528 RepID=A0A6H1Z7T6_9ZZZZ
MQFVLLFSMLSAVVGPLVKSVLRLLGIGLITYTGINLVINEAKDAIVSKFGALPPEIGSLLGLAQVDVAINIYFAAIVTRMLVSGLSQTDKIGRYKFLTGTGQG